VNDSILKLDGTETASVIAKYGSIDAKGKKDLEKLLKEEMPASAYEGISVFRPRGKDNIATVTFNGDYKGDDTMYLTLPDSPECYARVFRCDKDGDFSFWKDGEKVTEARGKGDIIIDTGVIFHKERNGKYEPMSLDAAEHEFGRKVKEAALDFKIKAISVDGGQRLQLATLYNGRAIGSDLAPKTSPIQKVDSHNPLENLESQGVVFDVVKIYEGKFQNLDRNRDVKLGENVTLLIGKEADESELVFVDPNTNEVERAINISDQSFEKTLTAELLKLEHSEIAAFAKRKFFKDCSTEDKDEIKRLLSSDNRQGLAKKMVELIPSICKDRLEKADKKYAAIYSDEKLRLFIPVELDGYGKPKFLYPVIQPKNEGVWGKSVEIFDAKGKMNPTNMDLIKKNFNRDFLRKFFTADEMGDSNPQEFLDKLSASGASNCEDFCERMKTYLKDIKVTVGYQHYGNEGLIDGGEEKYEKIQELKTKTFLVDQRTREGKPIEEVQEEVQAEKSKSKWMSLCKKVSNSSGRAA
jgi:hypothetical protein